MSSLVEIGSVLSSISWNKRQDLESYAEVLKTYIYREQ
jgi:hypothetical protein